MKWRAVLITFILVSSVFSVFSISNESPSPTRAVISAYTTHVPIFINGNSQFNNALYPLNGVVSGSGTVSNPYIIEGWDINASTANGIDIENTNAHFIVRDCYVHDGGRGISLTNCTNAGLINDICLDNENGILLQSSNSNTLSNNSCSNNSFAGIILVGSDNTTVSNNSCNSNSYYGISLFSSINNTLIDNRCASNNGLFLDQSEGNTLIGNIMERDGIFFVGGHISHWNTQTIDTSNTVNGKPVYYYKNQTGMTVPSGAGQVILANCTDFVIENQMLNDAIVGILLGFTSNTLIENNNCSNDGTGIWLESSSGNALSNNSCSHDGTGIWLYTCGGPSCNHNVLSNNNCSNDSVGILIEGDNNSMDQNWVCNNTQYGMGITSGSDNRIWNNTFIGNNGAGSVYNASHIQAYDYDAGTNNWWNSTSGYGNYWSDWTTPDANFDEIVDNPYNIFDPTPPYAKDYYPLVSPPIGTSNIQPFAFIDTILPNPATQGTIVTFTGHGTDSDGTIAAYSWRSSIDGQLSDQASFMTSSLSIGTHTIYFKVKDDKSTWSPEVHSTLVINYPPGTYHLKPLLSLSNADTRIIQKGCDLHILFLLTNETGMPTNGATLNLFVNPGSTLHTFTSSSYKGVLPGVFDVSLTVSSTYAFASLSIFLKNITIGGSQKPVNFDDRQTYTFTVGPRVGISSAGYNQGAFAKVVIGATVSAGENIEIETDGTNVYNLIDSYTAAVGLTVSLYIAKINLGAVKLEAGIGAEFGAYGEIDRKVSDLQNQGELIRKILVRAIVLGATKDAGLCKLIEPLLVPAAMHTSEDINSMLDKLLQPDDKTSGIYGRITAGASATIGFSSEKDNKKSNSGLNINLFQAGASGSFEMKSGITYHPDGRVTERIETEFSAGASFYALFIGGNVGIGAKFVLSRTYASMSDFADRSSSAVPPEDISLEMEFPKSAIDVGAAVLDTVTSGQFNFLSAISSVKSSLYGEKVSMRISIPVAQYINLIKTNAPSLYSSAVSSTFNTDVIDLISKAYITLANFPIYYEISTSSEKQSSFSIGGELFGIGFGFSVDNSQGFEYEVGRGRIILGPKPLVVPEVTYTVNPTEYSVSSWIMNNFDLNGMISDALNRIAATIVSFQLNCPVNATITSDDGKIIGYNGTAFVNEIDGAYMTINTDTEMFSLPKNHSYSIKINGIDYGRYNFSLITFDGGNGKLISMSNISNTDTTEDILLFSNDLNMLRFSPSDDKIISRVDMTYYTAQGNSSFVVYSIPVITTDITEFKIAGWDQFDNASATPLVINLYDATRDASTPKQTYQLKNGQNGLPSSDKTLLLIGVGATVAIALISTVAHLRQQKKKAMEVRRKALEAQRNSQTKKRQVQRVTKKAPPKPPAS